MSQTEAARRGLSRLGRIAAFVREDHTFVFLGTSVVAAVALWAASIPAPASGPLAAAHMVQVVLWFVCAGWLVISALALALKLATWKTYASTSPLVSAPAKRVERYLSYFVWASAACIVLDRAVFGFVDVVRVAAEADALPDGFLAESVYMTIHSGSIFAHGIATTVELAIFGTVIAFVIALLLVFLRLQQVDRSDNSLVRFLKIVGNGFARLYSTVIRGTPMMVQGLIIYYAGFGAFRSTGLDINAVQQVWSFFTAGLVTISLCSAAYMAEVLRSSIEAIDPGQTEAARSLGLTQWQAMHDIVFPQGIKNAIPAISNEFIINIKDSSVLSVVGVFDLMYATTSIAGIYFKQMELYIVAALIYLCLTLVASKILNVVSARLLGMSTRNVMSTAGKLEMEQEVVSGNVALSHE